MKTRPLGVTILAILAGLIATVSVIHTLQLLHLFPISIGPAKFFTFDLLGAILWGIDALIWIWVVRMLWNVDRRGWLFVAAISTINLIFIVINVLGGASWQSMAPAILLNGLALIYCLLPGTKAAFMTT